STVAKASSVAGSTTSSVLMAPILSDAGAAPRGHRPDWRGAHDLVDRPHGPPPCVGAHGRSPAAPRGGAGPGGGGAGRRPPVAPRRRGRGVRAGRSRRLRRPS